MAEKPQQIGEIRDGIDCFESSLTSSPGGCAAEGNRHCRLRQVPNERAGALSAPWRKHERSPIYLCRQDHLSGSVIFENEE